MGQDCRRWTGAGNASMCKSGLRHTAAAAPIERQLCCPHRVPLHAHETHLQALLRLYHRAGLEGQPAQMGQSGAEL